MHVFVRIAFILASGLPLTGSAPVATSRQSPTAPPLRVEIVGDDLGLWVSIAAAAIGAFAAIASWRAATAARRAAETGHEAAKHAATAAAAASETADIEKAALALTVRERRERQAKSVLVHWGSLIAGGGDFHVRVEVENNSGLRITDLEVWAFRDGERISEVQRMQDLGGSQHFVLTTTQDWYDLLAGGADRAKGAVRFTDAEGVRWERHTGDRPIELT